MAYIILIRDRHFVYSHMVHTIIYEMSVSFNDRMTHVNHSQTDRILQQIHPMLASMEGSGPLWD